MDLGIASFQTNQCMHVTYQNARYMPSHLWQWAHPHNGWSDDSQTTFTPQYLLLLAADRRQGLESGCDTVGRDRLFVADLRHVIKTNSFGNCWNALKCKGTQKNVAKIGEIEAECHCWKTDVCRGSTNCRFSLSLGVTMALPNSTARSDEAHLDQARQHVEWNPIPISYNII